ncbi:hypothetical protein ACHAWF_016299, partial [Thalassiosira exigua]
VGRPPCSCSRSSPRPSSLSHRRPASPPPRSPSPPDLPGRRRRVEEEEERVEGTIRSPESTRQAPPSPPPRAREHNIIRTTMDDVPPSSSGGSKPKAWKHIGLYGHAVGTFAVDPSAVAWKSAAGVDDVETRRVVPANRIAGAMWTVFGKSGHLRLLIKKEGKDKAEGGGGSAKLPSALRFDGFPANEYDVLSDAFKAHYGIALKRHAMSSGGSSWGNADVRDSHLVFRRCVLEDADEEGEEYEPRDGDEMLSLNLAEVSQCVLPGNNRNEIEMQFLESDTVEAGTDQLVAIRFYVPPDADADPADKEAPTSAESLQSRILKTASVRSASGAVIAEFDESKGTFLTPRGRYSVELYDGFLRMRGAKYDYKIRYDDVSRLFLLPKQDDVHMAFVIALDKPIRQGQQRYNMLVMQCTKEHSELDINLDDATLEKEYGGDLQPHMTGSFSNLVAKTFKVITKKKVFIPGKFATANHNACVKCALRANEGHLYPLEKQFIFIHKPAVLIRFDEIESVEFQRYAGGQVTTRNFDLCVTLRSTPGDTLSTKEYIFSGIDKSNFKPLYSFLKGKKIRLMNIEEVSGEGPSAAGPPAYNEMDDGGDGSESSEDEDYDQDNKSEESSSESDEDDDDMGSVASDDSDLAEHRKKAAPDAAVPKKSKGKKEKKKSKESSSAKGKKRKESSSPAKAASQKKKKKKDPNAPKKPMSCECVCGRRVCPLCVSSLASKRIPQTPPLPDLPCASVHVFQYGQAQGGQGEQSRCCVWRYCAPGVRSLEASRRGQKGLVGG